MMSRIGLRSLVTLDRDGSPSSASQVLSEQGLVGPVAFSPRPLSPKLLLGEGGNSEDGSWGCPASR